MSKFLKVDFIIFATNKKITDNALEYVDRSNYLRGILILIGIDKVISEEEREIILGIGKTLGFEKKFCETAISELLDNEYILQDVPKFSDIKLAESFIIDGLKVAVSDNELNPSELEFLKLTADANKLNNVWLSETIRDFFENPNSIRENGKLSVTDYI